MAEQLGFDLPSRTALDRDAFFVAPSNAVALAMIDTWPAWAGGKLVLCGPKGAGKTHLAHVWARVTGAQIIAASDLVKAEVPRLARHHVVVEDLPEIAGDSETETAVFHLHNLTLAEGKSLLMTGRPPVTGWGLHLPDLMSRLQGTTSCAVEAPDDALLSALLVKLMADRQLVPKPALISYLLKRMDRSYAGAIELVARLDAASLARQKPITTALAARVLDNTTPDA
ncbi:chromosomal replication initiator DnaA [Sulfitobacter sp. F26204]|uniref:HdaA/DnaA family protein n=1 Tax=Sulfitobacter sp. F26204 TaxID=2996014 RepID=UPI00225E3AD2|nr:chromosomal replication initiator DnaA [Sulfitobacter sp. F26204]MCX7559134.1 chromosomal replication initiator DnaA [Sulfitobacter sp. F26204]